MDYARELKALSIIFPYLPYLFSGAGLLLGWRFHQTGMVLSALAPGNCRLVCSQGMVHAGHGIRGGQGPVPGEKSREELCQDLTVPLIF